MFKTKTSVLETEIPSGFGDYSSQQIECNPKKLTPDSDLQAAGRAKAHDSIRKHSCHGGRLFIMFQHLARRNESSPLEVGL